MSKKPPAPVSARRTLGPVADLERHLPSDWWRTLFNSLYLKTDGDVVENVQNTSREAELIIRCTGLEPTDRILDLCCGQGRHAMELAKRGYQNIMGIDRSRYLIRLARKRAAQLGLRVEFREGDARKLRLPEDFFNLVVVMGNSFGYFDSEDEDVAVLEGIRRMLKPGGTVVLDLVDGEWMRNNFEKRSWEWIDENHFVCRERSLASDGMRLVSREVVVHAERGVIADQFYAERLYPRDRIIELLDYLGFTSVRFHGHINAFSDRDQDLGMMAHRMFITATAPFTIRKSRNGVPLFPEVMVLLGDPNLPDQVKRDGRFNPEDLETLLKLKEGMSLLKEYKFQYLENHASLFTELRANPPKFIFNLCDEGFNNDANMEPHIPAILDMLGIPYSGASSACLSLCYNKNFVRSIAASMDIPVPAETYFHPDDMTATLPSVFPALVKPNFGDGSLGITQNAVVNSMEDLINYLQTLRTDLPGCPILIQEFLEGTEYSVGIIGNPGLNVRVLPVLEVDYSDLDPELPKILGYESKWLPDSPYWQKLKYREAQLSSEQQQKLIDYSMALFERLGCRDYARIDFRMDAMGEVKLLEMNPNPGWCWDGKLNMMASFGGIQYHDLLRLILEAAQERIAEERSKNRNDLNRIGEISA